MIRRLPILLSGAFLPFSFLAAQGFLRVDSIQSDTNIHTYNFFFDIPFGQTFINPSSCTGSSIVKSKTFDALLRPSVEVYSSEEKMSAYISWGSPSGKNTEGTMVENNQGRTMRNSISNMDYSQEGIEKNVLELRTDTEIPINLVMSLGFGSARLNLSNLHLRSADIVTAESDVVVLFNQPNHCKMGTFHIKAGTSELLLRNIENAHSEKVVIENGMGNTTLVLGENPAFPTNIYVEVGAGICQVSASDQTPLKIVVKDNVLSSVELPVSFKAKGTNIFVNSSFENNPVNAVIITVDLGMGSFKVIPYHQ